MDDPKARLRAAMKLQHNKRKIDSLEKVLRAKREKIAKLEGWLKYLWEHYWDISNHALNDVKTDFGISDYIKAMDK